MRNSEFGINAEFGEGGVTGRGCKGRFNSECGIRNAEFGMRNSEFGINAEGGGGYGL